MRIVIDLQGAQTSGSRHRGIGRYSTSLTEAILRNRKDHDVHLALNGAFGEGVTEVRERFGALLPATNIHVWDQLPSVAQNVNGSEARRLASQNLREFFIRGLKPDVIHIASLFEGLADDGVCSIGNLYNDIQTSVTVYDLIPLINRREYLTDPLVLRWYMDRIDHLRRANAFLAISDSARQEAIDHLGVSSAAAVNIGTAADAHFKVIRTSQEEEIAIRKDFGLTKPFVMYTGGIDLRKNIERLVASYASLPESIRAGHQLAIVCSAHEQDRTRLLRLARSLGMADGELVLTGFVSEKDLLTLYNLTSLFIFPSWHEGFGLPALEAMQCGAPVVASNRSSLPEVMGIAEAMFDPFDQGEMTKIIRKGLEDADYRALLLENGKRQVSKFDWDICGKRAIETFERMHECGTRHLRLPDHRPRLAYVSPMQPAHTGVADYSAELLSELTRYYKIDAIVKDGTASNVSFPLAPNTIRVIESSEFHRRFQEYDRILYHFGNSDHHDYMFPLLEETSGVVVLHDFYLSAIVSYREWHHQEKYGWINELYRSHGYPALVSRRDAEDVYDTVWEYPCSRSVIEQASAVIVHSQNSIDLARTWYGEITAEKLRLIPHLRNTIPITVDKEATRKEFNFAPDELLFCAFGLIGPTKLSHQLVKAWLASSLAQDEKCRLIFVGQNDPDEYGAEFDLLRFSAPEGQITVTGWTDSELFQKYLSIADVGVQLRTLSRGETSGTVLDCMTHGVPLIVNDNGGMADLAGDAAIVLNEDFEIAQLTQTLEELARNPSARSRLGANGKRRIAADHSPAACGKAYQTAIEAAHANSSVLARMFNSTGRAGLSQFETAQFSSALTPTMACDPPRLLVDVTAIARADAGTGIQRVVRNVLLRLLTAGSLSYRVEPVFVDPEAAQFRFARSFTAKFLDVDIGSLDDEIVDFTERDTLFLFDLNPVLLKFVESEILRLKRRGVNVASLVYDLLPIKHPDFFPEGAKDLHRDWLKVIERGTSAICISSQLLRTLKAT